MTLLRFSQHFFRVELCFGIYTAVVVAAEQYQIFVAVNPTTRKLAVARPVRFGANDVRLIAKDHVITPGMLTLYE